MAPTLGAPLNDDRAHPLPSVRTADVWETISQGSGPPRKRLIKWWMQVAILAAVGVWLMYIFMRNPSGFFMRYLGVLIAIVGIVIAAYLVGALRGNGKHGSSRLTALIMAAGRCGACGFSLTDARREDDGHAICPECGAAWHTDRFTMLGHDLRTSPLLARSMNPRGEAHLIGDDRGVPLDQPCTSFSQWVRRSPRTAMNVEPMRVIAARNRRWRVILTTIVATLIWIALGVFFILASDLGPHERFRAYALWGGITGAIGLAIVARAWWSELRQLPFRKAVLVAGICPNCRHDLPKPTGPWPSFDGFTACTHCGRAWQLAAPTPSEPS